MRKRRISLAASIAITALLAACQGKPDAGSTEPAGTVIALSGNATATAPMPTEPNAPRVVPRALGVGSPVAADDFIGFDVDTAKRQAADAQKQLDDAVAKNGQGSGAAQMLKARADAAKKRADDAEKAVSATDKVVIELSWNHERFTVTPGHGEIVSSDPAFSAYVVHYIMAVLDNGAVKWVLLVFLFVMPLASILTWMERRQSAMMQDRLGPNRANIGPIKLKGILHFVADALKMIFKEDFVPGNVHKGLFALAPILALAPVLIAFAIIPFGPTIYPHELFSFLHAGAPAGTPPNLGDGFRGQIFQVDFGLIFYFAVLTLANYGGTLAGWASYNKWALLGGLRSSSQMMSYEVTMGLSLMGVFLVTGSLEPGYITATGWHSHWVASNPLNWLWLPQLPALMLFFTAAIAETKRAPFDIPEGEPEIIGYFVEYSGIRWGMFFLAEFIEIVFISAVIATVFFGGWQVPFLESDGFHFHGAYAALPHIAVAALQLGAFGAKVVLLCWFQLLLRWTLPRFRADQLMNLGWKWLLPFSLAWTMVTGLVVLIFL